MNCHRCDFGTGEGGRGAADALLSLFAALENRASRYASRHDFNERGYVDRPVDRDGERTVAIAEVYRDSSDRNAENLGRQGSDDPCDRF